MDGMSLTKGVAAVGFLAVLAGCGGGGGGSDVATVDSLNTVALPKVSSQAKDMDRYKGDFVSGCFKSSYAVDASTGVALYYATERSVVARESMKGAIVETVTFYDKSDCTGIARYSKMHSGTMTLDQTTTLAGVQAHKVTFTMGSYFEGISAQSITMNGVKLSGPYISAAYTYQDLIYVDADGYYYEGDYDKGFDATGYPLAVLAKPTLVKK